MSYDSQGITDLDRLSYTDLAALRDHALEMRRLVAQKINTSGPLYGRLDALVEDIQAARHWVTRRPGTGSSALDADREQIILRKAGLD